jgi:hypothetical protein
VIWNSRISKGSEAPPKMYPWHVTIRTKGVCNCLLTANNTRLNLFSNYFKFQGLNKQLIDDI